MRQVPCYPGYYVTANGAVISLRSGEERVISQRLHKGYFHVNVRVASQKGKWLKIPVHQLMLIAYKGDKRNHGLVCRHLNGNPLDNNISNLEWGTAKENVMDSIKHGTAVCIRLGEEHPRSKLKTEQVVKIKEMIAAGLSNKEIAQCLGLLCHNIKDIRAGKAWKHLGRGHKIHPAFVQNSGARPLR